MNATGSQNNEGVASPSRKKLKQKPGKNKEQTMMNARVSQKLKQTLAENKIHQVKQTNKTAEWLEHTHKSKFTSTHGSESHQHLGASLHHQNLMQKVGENKVSGGVRGSIPRMEPGLPRRKGHMIFDPSVKSKNPSKTIYSEFNELIKGPRKGVLKRPDLQNASTKHDRQPIHKGHGYLRFQDKGSVIHEDNVTTENLYQEDHQELEHVVDSPQTNTDTSAHHQENIGSSSNGPAITRKESRALSANRKSRSNQRKLVFEVDECAGRIVGDDSQIFITKGGCVVREHAVFDGSTWKKQPDSLKQDIMSKSTEHSDFKFTCPRMVRVMGTQLASQHRSRQYRLHKHYLKYPSKEEAITHPPDGVKVAEWVLLCARFASEEFQKLSTTNKQNRSCNEIPPTNGTKSVARVIHGKRKRGEEVTAIEGFKIAHFVEKKQAMINEKADELWCDLKNKEASSSSTSAEICMEVLGHIPGHIRGRSASTRHVFETESLRMDLNSEKEKSKQLEKDHLELKEDHLKLQKEHVSLTKKVNFLLKHFTAWQSAGNGIEETEDFDESEDYEDYVDA